MNTLQSEAAPEADKSTLPWKMLVVDDDESVLQVTRLALIDFQFEGRGVELLYADSNVQAQEVFREHPDIALILLDVVMETDDAGFRFAEFVRKDMSNPYVRIIVRTGQSGRMSVPEVVRTYDVNDFCEKTDLTSDRLFVVLHTALKDREFLLSLHDMKAELADSVEKLQASNQKLQVFSHMAAHDLQAPLRKIAWRVQRASSGLSEGADAEVVQEEIAAVERNCRFMAGLLDSLLTYAHLRQVPQYHDEVQLGTVFQNVLSNLESDIRECQGTVAIPANADDYRVMGEANLLTTLFQNLVANALKFVKPKMIPIVTVRLGNTTLINSELPAVSVEVEDEGIGIPDESLGNIFEAFERAPTSQGYSGAGLGLSIAKQIVEDHGGTITLRSELGKGTTIQVLLPVN